MAIEREDLETRLAKVQSEASFNLAEKIKAKDMVKEVEEKLKEANDCTNQVEHKVRLTTCQLRDEEEKAKELKGGKSATTIFL